MTVWLRPASPGEIPSYGRTDLPWWWRVDEDGFRLPTADEHGRKCTTARCPEQAIAVRVEEITRYDTWTKFERRRFCCEAHLYGRRIENGQVVAVVPRFDLEAAPA